VPPLSFILTVSPVLPKVFSPPLIQPKRLIPNLPIFSQIPRYLGRAVLPLAGATRNPVPVRLESEACLLWFNKNSKLYANESNSGD
jgi:hypothetical protein